MDIPQDDGTAIRRAFIAAMIAVTLGGCSTSREQPPPAQTNANLAAVRAPQPFPKAAKAKPAVTRAVSSSAAGKKSTTTILVQIHQVNLKEIALCRLAQGKATTSELRAYADQLVQDHTNADQMVFAAAQKSATRLHENKRGKLVSQKLSSASGRGFDRLFLQQISSDHEKLLRALQQEREDASDDDIEALIDQIVPILEQHRELAQILMKNKRV